MAERFTGIFGVCEMRDKVIVKFNGGLGNQMFQWAFGKMLEITNDVEVYFDMSYFSKSYARPYQLDVFNIEPRFIEDLGDKLKLSIIWLFRDFLNKREAFNITFFSEKQFNFDPHISKIENNSYIEGFFQTEKYFKSIEEVIREDFKFIFPMDVENLKFAQRIIDSNSISLHIRRGDYVQKKRYSDAYAECSLDYYQRGVEYIAQRFPEPILFIFSDDIPWVRKNLKLPYKSVYVSHNTGKRSSEDMRLMSLCRHNIIANSSFSWWGAWLNKNPEKLVIAPQKWFNDDNIVQTDVIPQGWVRLEN